MSTKKGSSSSFCARQELVVLPIAVPSITLPLGGLWQAHGISIPQVWHDVDPVPSALKIEHLWPEYAHAVITLSSLVVNKWGSRPHFQRVALTSTSSAKVSSQCANNFWCTRRPFWELIWSSCSANENLVPRKQMDVHTYQSDDVKAGLLPLQKRKDNCFKQK